MILVESILTIWEDLIMNRKSRRGFTLAELLVVVAIIAVLTAVSIPIFTSQLNKSKNATNMANIKAAQNAAIVDYMSNDKNNAYRKSIQDKYGNTITVGYYSYVVSSGTFITDQGKVDRYPTSVNGIYQTINIYISEDDSGLVITSYPYCNASATDLDTVIVDDQGFNKFQ
jgi:prepilin-type N-terminal cleavage/methylation domain-containing protein